MAIKWHQALLILAATETDHVIINKYTKQPDKISNIKSVVGTFSAIIFTISLVVVWQMWLMGYSVRKLNSKLRDFQRSL